ncbi:TetR/AcrR family transcriptional regulator [Nocardioides jejuensis]|uniref:TetR/AcrR family transcriptional regulator n=1 Tax=Nocardioides jejuensis TaxID=2502782 RepID=A0A4R1C0J2_9ACTN|nr:TetR/AcrR family transcriptional regulator [Nocardioides jejuensis]TCJ23891.1 TetR/AcrR family transcriptional regulator [Nocardioides jejuensis]
MSQVVDAAGSVDGRDRRWEDHRQERRERLLVAAVALIDRQGGDVGVAAIAAEAGIPRSVVYKLFRDREDLDEQIRIRIIQEATATLAPLLVPRGTLREMVRVAAKTYVDWVTAHANLHRFIGTGSTTRPTPGSPSIAGGKAAFAQNVADLVILLLKHLDPAASVSRGSAENLAFALTGVTDSVVNRWLVAGRSRSTKKELIQFLTEASCGVILGAAGVAGVDLDLDAPVAL